MAPWSAATDHGAEDSAPAPRTRPLIFPAFRFVPERSSRIVVPNASSRQNRTSPASAPGLSYFTNSRSAKRANGLCFCPRLFVSFVLLQTQTTQRPWDSYRSHSSTLIDIILVAAIMYWIYRYHQRYERPYIIPRASSSSTCCGWWSRRSTWSCCQSILGQFISVGVIALIIVFQPELRRFLQMIGMRQKGFELLITRIFSAGGNVPATNAAPSSVPAPSKPRETMTGALIVIGQQSDLRLITEGGIAVDARISTHRCSRICFQELAPARRVPWSSRRPHRRGEMHPTRHAERRAQSLRHTPPRRHRHERNFGRHHPRGLRGDGRHLHSACRRAAARHRPEKLQQTLQRYLNINTRRRKDKEVAE